jgi:GntR family transcriptional regulator
VLLFRSVAAAEVDPELVAALRVAGAEPLFEMRRLRIADATPVILEHRFVVARLCPGLTEAQARGSLYAAWTREHGLRIDGADDVIRAVALKRDAAGLLEVPPRTPALEVASVGFVDDGRPLWWERTLYRGDLYEFQSRLGPVQAATPARGVLRATRSPRASDAARGAEVPT